jgi:vanillate O-demethylase ferredoxin subunit
MTTNPEPMLLQVLQAQTLNPLVRMLHLARTDGGVLPGYTAGAHIQVQVKLPDGSSDWRAYSLINFSTSANATAAPLQYCIAVRRDDAGRGGSRWMHEQPQAGTMLAAHTPRNDFPLKDCAGSTVLLAGGIGVTPLASMAAQCRAQGQPVRLHYAGRSRSLMAFLPELQALLGDGLELHIDDEAVGLDIAALLGGCAPQDKLYVCGPQPMLDAVLAKAQTLGWPPERVHFELFAAPAVTDGDHAFEIVLEQSGRTLTVPADKSILDVLIDAGCDPLFDCKRGECGVCAVSVLEGEIEHRDYVLSAREKGLGNVMHTCVSRAKGSRLVLDL